MAELDAQVLCVYTHGFAGLVHVQYTSDYIHVTQVGTDPIVWGLVEWIVRM